ncbi:MAG: hypothetical protein A3G91_02110 [Omnitrophica WOR_2 bacterium RIFCSPLOWO2_12_FULL_50_9]|nr:MAG: hypothetical protein A3D87_08035 [Omnitrophica WOR_2 bacterium RIFCSPHIGHO2_02_FULL_50_17]OGX43603.1 MAG: hypothetical protein A3G91_02110 [Omnitrophica WOR_2 bacterium RIFCSPLOWO2_12_FULL_50_9]
MMHRKELLATGHYYHVFNKSIADFRIFNTHYNSERFLHTLRYYQLHESSMKLSQFLRLQEIQDDGFEKHFIPAQRPEEKLVEILAYCLMPTHVHLILKQLRDDGISQFMQNIQNSYTRFFNEKHRRKGPLWVGRFKSVLVDSDEYLLHLTRYIHLNPVSAGLAGTPKKWPYSSYHEYSGNVGADRRICRFDDVIAINAGEYENFVNDRISHQKELAAIKSLILE